MEGKGGVYNTSFRVALAFGSEGAFIAMAKTKSWFAYCILCLFGFLSEMGGFSFNVDTGEGGLVLFVITTMMM